MLVKKCKFYPYGFLTPVFELEGGKKQKIVKQTTEDK